MLSRERWDTTGRKLERTSAQKLHVFLSTDANSEQTMNTTVEQVWYQTESAARSANITLRNGRDHNSETGREVYKRFCDLVEG